MDRRTTTASVYMWIRWVVRMPKWKADAKEFTVSVNYHETRGTLTTIPKPITEHLGRPERITFVILRKRVEVRPASRTTHGN